MLCYRCIYMMSINKSTDRLIDYESVTHNAVARLQALLSCVCISLYIRYFSQILRTESGISESTHVSRRWIRSLYTRRYRVKPLVSISTAVYSTFPSVLFHSPACVPKDLSRARSLLWSLPTHGLNSCQRRHGGGAGGDCPLPPKVWPVRKTTIWNVSSKI